MLLVSLYIIEKG